MQGGRDKSRGSWVVVLETGFRSLLGVQRALNKNKLSEELVPVLALQNHPHPGLPPAL